jgi:hypothetical protein
LGYAGDFRARSNPKSNPFTKESGMSSQADDSHWAVLEFAEAELGDVQ